MNAKMSRREMLGKSLLGTVGGLAALDQLGNLGWMEKLLLPSLGGTAGEQAAGLAALRAASGHTGTYELLRAAMQGTASLLRVQQAFAQPAPDANKEWAVVTIKVVNHVYTPLVFRLGLLGADNNVTTESGVPLASADLTTAKSHMMTKGVDQVSDTERWRKLRLNKWFSNLLQTGKSDAVSASAAPITDASVIGVAASSVFPESVAVQAGLHLNQEFASNNHSLINFRLRMNEGDLSHFAEKHGIIKSPLGVSAFMMGDQYDSAEGSLKVNAVLSDSSGEISVAGGRSVKSLVDTFAQSVGGGGYSDKAPFDTNLVVAFDKAVESDPKLRRAMLESTAKIQTTLDRLKRSADLESETQALTQQNADAFGALQANAGSATAPKQEFLAQCALTADALRMPGRPIRNFSLFLNCTDLDGSPLDVAKDGAGGSAIRSYSYVEGMRQLALGLHVLSKVISESRNVVVVVVSEGGRSSFMGDDKVSFGLVMGPKGPGGLDDMLYADLPSINQTTNTVLTGPGSTRDVKWTVDGLKEEGGASLAGKNVTTTGDWQLGVAEFLAEKMGVSGAMSGQGQFVKLKRGA